MEGALSLIVCREGTIVAEEYYYYNNYGPDSINKFTWEVDDRGYPPGAAYLRITPSDMVKFGNLILNKGKYNNMQIVPDSWIITMTSPKISTNNELLYGPEYGYQIWLGNSGGKKYFMAMGWVVSLYLYCPIIIPSLQLHAGHRISVMSRPESTGHK